MLPVTKNTNKVDEPELFVVNNENARIKQPRAEELYVTEDTYNRFLRFWKKRSEDTRKKIYHDVNDGWGVSLTEIMEYCTYLEKEIVRCERNIKVLQNAYEDIRQLNFQF